jgi:ribosomal protein L4
VIRSEGLNVHDLLRYKNLLITKAAVEKLESRLSGTKSAAAEGESK